MFGLKQEHIEAICRCFDAIPAIREVVIYGSRAKETHKPGSDIDLTIIDDDISSSDLVRLDSALDDLLLPYKFDLSLKRKIKNSDLIDHINRAGKVFYQKEADKSEWKEYKLGDVAEITSAKRIFYSEYVPKGIPFYRSKEIIDKYHNREIQTELFISESKYDEIKNKFGIPLKDDILLTSVGTLGIPYLVKDDDIFYFKDGNLTWIRNILTDILNANFLYIWLKSNIGKQKLDEVVIGSTQPALTISGLKTLNVLLPPLPEQRAIASVLSSLDDKIDLLHRQNATLEKMAETLFRQWFVEEAKEGWEEKILYDIIELVGGGTPKTSVYEYWDGDICWLSGGDIATNHKSFISASEKNITKLGLKNSSAKLLPQFSTIISARGTVGKFCMLSKPMAFSQSNYGVNPKYQDCYFFTYLLINHSVAELQSAAYGSVFDTITTNTFKSYTINLPGFNYIKEFDNFVEPYFLKMKTNQEQIYTLTTLRDTLLPKLMSGEVKIEVENRI